MFHRGYLPLALMDTLRIRHGEYLKESNYLGKVCCGHCSLRLVVLLGCMVPQGSFVKGVPRLFLLTR